MRGQGIFAARRGSLRPGGPGGFRRGRERAIILSNGEEAHRKARSQTARRGQAVGGRGHAPQAEAEPGVGRGRLDAPHARAGEGAGQGRGPRGGVGGWREDRQDKFTDKGRTPTEQEAFSYVRRLARYRRDNPVLHQGKLTQFVPENNIYVYFRHDQHKTVMVVFNSGNQEAKVPTARYQERMAGYSRALNLGTGTPLEQLSELTVAPKSTLVLELMR